MRLDTAGDGKPKGPVPDAGFVKSLAHGGHLAYRQETADGPKVGLEDVVSIVDQAFPESVEAAESFSTRDQNIHFSGQSRRAFKIVSRKRLFEPIDTSLLECFRGG